ncbi:MAG: protein kinase [Myxococcales bacterium]|nr:protein kinase [Myxococcales bacterium]
MRGTVGGGGMGDVYRVFDPVTRRELALKILKFSYPRALHYFKREFRAVARLNHVNLVKLHDLHVEDGSYFFTMELIEGSDLYVWVNGHNRVVTDTKVLAEPKRLKRVHQAFVGLMQALAYLHDNGCIHRDIKPSNVLVDRGGTVKLVDFGIVKETLPGNEGQSLSQVFGTSTYFSPEQSETSRVDSATDLYAAGVVLYELMAGTPPFEGESATVIEAHRTQPPPPLLERVPGTDPKLAAVCMELLHKDKQARPSAVEVLEALGEEVQRSTGRTFDFVGRRGARRFLYDRLEDVRRGEGRIVLIDGASGAGKTALVERFTQEAHVYSASAFTGACVHRDHVPLRGLDTVVERLAEAYRKQTARLMRRMPGHVRGGLIAGFTFLGELLPVDQHGEPGERPGLGLRSLLAGLAEKRLLVICVEQLHLADEATLSALEALTAGGGLPPFLLLLTVRGDAVERPSRVSAFIELLQAHPRAHRLTLEPFELDETRQMVEAVVPSAPGWIAEHVHEQTGGVPLFVAEMAEWLADAPEGGAPTFEEAVARRIADLSADAQQVLAAICLCPRPVPGRVLERACSLDADGLYAALLALDAVDLVRTEADSQGHIDAVPVHLRLMQVAKQGMEPEDIRNTHTRLARAFELEQGSAFDLRYHWQQAGQPQHAAAFARSEAKRARERGEHARAADLLSLALSDAADQADQVKLLVLMADSLALAGRYLAAATALEDVARLSEEEGIRWRARRCQLYLMAGNLADFARAAQELPENARVPLADLLLPLDPAQSEAMLGEADTRTARLVRGRLLAGTHSRRAIREAERLVDSVEAYGIGEAPSRQVNFALARAAVCMAQGRFAEADAALTAAQPNVEYLAAHDLGGLRLDLTRAEVALARGRVDAARSAALPLVVEARRRGLLGLRARACVIQARVHLEAGEPHAADRLLDEAARSLPAEPASLPVVEQALARAHSAFARADLTAAEHGLHTLRKDEALRPFLGRRETARAFALLHARICMVRALRLWQAGLDVTAAARVLRQARLALERALPTPEGWLALIDAVSTLVEGQREAAEAQFTTLAGSAGRFDNAQLEALVLILLATVRELGAKGDDDALRDEAAALLDEAGSALPPEARAVQG